MTANESDSAPRSLVVSLAFIAGAGLTLMVVAAAIGVIQAEDADTRALGLLFAAGLVLLVGGIGAWLAVERPFMHFDDINVPAPDEHHDEEDHQHTETALIAAPHHELAQMS